MIIYGGAGNDSIENEMSSDVTISGGTGNDTIRLGLGAKNNVIEYKAGDGNDTIIFSLAGTNTLSISGGEYVRSTIANDIVLVVGTDSITIVDAAKLTTPLNIIGSGTEGETQSKSITLTEGNDTYNNTLISATIQALGGDDTITNSGSDVHINVGKGDDSIKLLDDAASNVINYAAGDGDDTVTGFNASDTLSISDAAYTLYTVGSDVVVAVGAGSILLSGAANLDSLNIVTN